MIIFNGQVDETIKRYDTRQKVRGEYDKYRSKGQILKCDSWDRIEKRLARIKIDPRQISAFKEIRVSDTAVSSAAEMIGYGLALERVLGKNDFVDVGFLQAGLKAARSVCRIRICNSSGKLIGYGTGFLVSPTLLITNNHVLGSSLDCANSVAEFGYEATSDGQVASPIVFPFNASEFFLTDARLDFTIVSLRRTNQAGRNLFEFGYLPLIAEEGKVINSEYVNIIQHPSGEVKQLALRENQIVDVLPDYLHYKADTAPGSSGSPVFNDQWEVVALHHSGVPAKKNGQIQAIGGGAWNPALGQDKINWIANEGVRVSRIASFARSRVTNPAERKLLEEVFVAPTETIVINHSSSVTTPSHLSQSPQAVVKDGLVTWNIPLSVSVRLGNTFSTNEPASLAVKDAENVALYVKPQEFGSLGEAVKAAKAKFAAFPEVVRIRAGYKFSNGWITKEPAVVIEVKKKLSESELVARRNELLPQVMGIYPVDVVQSFPPNTVALEKGFPTYAEYYSAQLEKINRDIGYKAPAGLKLTEVNSVSTALFHVSPDAGWKSLEAFLSSVSKRLTIAMYDLTAPHILEAMKKYLRKPGARLNLAIQPKEASLTGSKADDIPEAEWIADFETAFPRKFACQLVPVGRGGLVATSYHIKVAVADGRRMWLSSGNWQTSNQPNLDPINKPKDKVASTLSGYNREWHVIIENAALASIFEKHIESDIAQSSGLVGEPVDEAPELFVPESYLMDTGEFEATRTAPKFFAPLTVTNKKIRIQPLLTPDNYATKSGHVLKLIKSATEKLYFENQSMTVLGENEPEFQELLEAIIEKQREGVDVRIIVRDLIKRESLENMQALGFDMSLVRTLKGCHTKGIVIDRKAVLLGSHNWSNSGVLTNRDASLIVFEEGVAQYFEEIFLFDWDRARQKLPLEMMTVELASPGAKAPSGLVTLSASEWLDQ